MSDDDEVTEEVLARLSREMAETVRVSLRQGEPEAAVVDSRADAGEEEDDAPGPRTSAVSWSSRENPDDDDIMISALVSAMAKGREISASLGGGTDPVSYDDPFAKASIPRAHLPCGARGRAWLRAMMHPRPRPDV